MLLKNFWATLKRYKAASILNILGLSVAFAAFAVIMMQVRYELSYDRHHDNFDRIYRIEMLDEDDGVPNYWAVLPRKPFNGIKNAVPEIEEEVIFSSGLDIFLSVDIDQPEYIFSGSLMKITWPAFEVFDFPIVSGSLADFGAPGSIVISESQADRFFPGENPVGKPLRASEIEQDLRIIAVYKDFPKNSFLKNRIYANLGEEDAENSDDWNYYCYILAGPRADREELRDKISAYYTGFYERTDEHVDIRLLNLNEIHFQNDLRYDIAEKANKGTVHTLLLVALLTLCIAAINFINFSIALVPARLRNINTQKVLGNSDGNIRRAMLAEAVGTCFLAGLLALWFIYAASASPLASYMSAPLTFAGNEPVIFGSFGLFLLVGLAAGLYPAFYITSFQPALVLKGSFGLSPRGQMLRKILVSFQYVISIALIICAVFIRVQNNYVRDFPIGIDQDNVLITPVPYDIYEKSEAFAGEIKRNPDISEVSFSVGPVVSRSKSRWGGIRYRDQNDLNFQMLLVSNDFLRTVGITVREGRDFNPADDVKQGALIFNEAARAMYDIQLNDEMRVQGKMTEIVGFTDDFNFLPLYQGVEPICIYLRPLYNQNLYAYFRVSGNDVGGSIRHIRRSIAEMSSMGLDNIHVDFLSRSIGELYEKDRNLSSLIFLFSGLAIVISLIGVFGLVLFETQYRRKEIGLRRINGASIGEILRMLNTGFVRIVLVCFVIAAPAAWYAMNRWLIQFAYKSTIHWWIFVVALLTVMLITILTVTLQSYRAATENPVNAIKAE